MSARAEDLKRIARALDVARAVLADFSPGRIEHRVKAGGDPVTEADTAVNDALLHSLPADGEGWLSEETADDRERLKHDRVWVVDPVDGTKEFVAGIPEWCVSVGLVENGVAVAGGIAIPGRDLVLIGSVEHGVRANGRPVKRRETSSLEQASILASRSEVKRGEWERFDDAPFAVQPMGSVAAKMGLVAAGLADATWTLVPKHEWDVAAGTALVHAAGGEVWTLDGSAPRFNKPVPKFDGLLAAPAALAAPIRAYLSDTIATLPR